MFLIPPIRSSTSERRAYVIILILLLSKIIPTYFYYIKKGLVCVIIMAPFSRQSSFYTKCIKANMCSSCNVYSVFNTKYTRLPTLYSLRIFYLICLRVLGLIRY